MTDRLQDLKQIATDRGGLCLSDKYVNSQTKMWWQCANGHRWQIPPNNIKQGTWCRKCAKVEAGKNRRTPIGFFKEYAISKGGFCLSDTYENQKTRLTFQCAQKHQWTTSGGSLKSRKSWCPYCASPSFANTPELKLLRFIQLQKTAEERCGKLLSTEYINTKTKYKFQCASGHTWATSVDVIRNGSWCKKCATKFVSDRQRDTLQTFIDIAISKGGKCHSTSYLNQHSKMLFECSEGHQWHGLPSVVKRGAWCRKCYGTAKSDIEEMKSIATARGGSCLSSEYITDAVKLKWQCCEGHIWEASPNNIKHDKWCPTCSEGLGERICRLFFQKYFGFDFIKVRPQWLKNSKGFLLELDGYCEELKLAFEHQGRQHYSDVSFFSRQVRYDEEKRLLCQQTGVTLIEIPEVLNDTKIKDLKPFIIQECKKNNVKLPANISEIEITPFEIFTYTKNQERRLIAQKAEAKINSKGGKLLETHLTDKGISFKVLCDNNHLWSITNTNLNRERWCPQCRQETPISIQFAKQEIANEKALEREQLRTSRELKRNLSRQEFETRKPQAPIRNSKPKIDRRQLSIEKMLAVANSKGGECLSPYYIKDTTPLLWKCNENHTWMAKPNSIKAGSWCPTCSTNNQWSFDDIVQMIEKRNGKCFSNSFANNYSKLDIQCEHEHRFTTTVKSIKIGCWCPQCAIDERARKKQLSIDDMNVLAKRKHGKCLSVSYTNSTIKLLWECKNGHQFYSRPGNVQTGYWCPTCAINKVIDKASDERKKQIEQILASKQGAVFSLDKKANRKSEATWQCKNGHTWKTRVANILDGHWCPRCSNSENWNSKKTTIDEIKQLAKSKGGDCLNTSYDSGNSKLTFVCHHGHTWSALWSNIKHKNCWCPICAVKNR